MIVYIVFVFRKNSLISQILQQAVLVFCRRRYCNLWRHMSNIIFCFDILKKHGIIKTSNQNRQMTKGVFMNFLKRVWLIIASNLNALLSTAEDPEKILNQVVGELGENMKDVRLHLANAMKDYAQLERQLETNQKLFRDYDNKAMLALKNGNEQLAIEALKRKQETERVVNDLQKEVTEQGKLIDQLKTNFNTLEKRVDQAREKKNTLVAKNNRAVARIKSTQAIAGNGKQGELLDAFDRMAAKIEDTEDMAVAIGMVTKRNFDEEMRELEQEDGVAQQLEEMKAKMGLKSSARKVTSNGSIEDADIVVS